MDNIIKAQISLLTIKSLETSLLKAKLKGDIIPDQVFKIVDLEKDSIAGDLIDTLTGEQEEKLQDNFAEEGDYMGCDDDMPDAFDAFLVNIEVDELLKILTK